MVVGEGQVRKGEALDEFDEDEYNEEEDEDFDPNKLQNASEEEQSTADGVKSVDVNYSTIESDTGGLIKTRRARQREQELQQRSKYEAIDTADVTESINDIWDALKRQSTERLASKENVKSVLDNINQGPLQEEKIWINRSYKFAGEVTTEKKLVPKSSAEAQEYLRSLKDKEKAKLEKTPANSEKKDHNNDRDKPLRRPLKRPPILEEIISGALKPKLTTLEKSKLDWATYVDKEGINEELTLHNKDGYLAKQDFLNRVEGNKEQQYKQFRKRELELKFQGQ